jgi:Serine carboxypeptidase S28
MARTTDTEQAGSYQQQNAYGAVPKVEQDNDIEIVENHSNPSMRNPYVKAGIVSMVLTVAFFALRSPSAQSNVAMAKKSIVLDDLREQVEILGKKKKDLKDWQTPLYYTDQLVDHFAQDTGTWANRYYVGEEHWKGPGYPMFVIMGGEGAVDEVLYPYIMDILAPRFGAYVLQTEHRFYGTSYPTEGGPDVTPTADEYKRLFRPDQALEDFVRITRHIQGKIGCSIDRTDPNYCPIITVGASYPGFLSAMMRFVHPEVVDMSYASSAPLKLYDQSMSQYVYFDHITMVADRDYPGCKQGQRSTLESVKQIIENMPIKQAAKELGICHNKIPDYITTPELLAYEIVMMVGFSWADFNMDYHPPKDPSTA